VMPGHVGDALQRLDWMVNPAGVTFEQTDSQAGPAETCPEDLTWFDPRAPQKVTCTSSRDETRRADSFNGSVLVQCIKGALK
jgi:hypothetical protein